MSDTSRHPAALQREKDLEAMERRAFTRGLLDAILPPAIRVPALRPSKLALMSCSFLAFQAGADLTGPGRWGWA